MNLSLAEAIFWIAALACVVAQIALLRSSISTKGENRSNLVPASPRTSEVAWTILPALVLTVVLLATWRKISERDEHQHMDHGTMSVAATGKLPRSTAPGN
jgi:heme/copper-type cytochrome/quinol oxidase subunit 2